MRSSLTICLLRRGAAFAALLSALLLSSPAASASGDGADRMVDAKNRLMALYDPERGQWEGAEWWHQPVILETLIRYARQAVNDAGPISAVTREVFEKNRRNHFINDYFDDSSWWALCWLSAYEWTGERRYLDEAAYIFRYLSQKGWDGGSCGGGMLWHTAKHYKNAITNEQFLRIAIKLYRISVREGEPNEEYLKWAERSWNWFRASGMINDGFLVNDGLENCRNNGQNPWTYNQGVLLGALADLYAIKKDAAYLDLAYRIAGANISYNSTAQGILLEKGCGDSDCGRDGVIFKGIFIRYLEALIDASPADRPEKKDLEGFLSRNSSAAWANRTDAGLFGVRWDRVFPHGHQAAAQSAGLDLLLAASDGGPITPSVPKACLYGDAGFGGAEACYQVPSDVRMLPNTLHDKASSIRVDSGACLTVYEDHGFQGRSRDITSSEGWLGDQWNDTITSLRVYRCPR